MRGNFVQRLNPIPRAKQRLVLVMFSLLAAYISSAQAQQRNNEVTRPSDLTLQNLDRVAASAAEIRGVLLSNPGLLVELKRWAALDAAEHGRILKDSDLTNDAIFDRLERDIHFRSVATSLVQRYGYLIPKINPDSEVGKQRDLLIQERAKWLAQNQEEELAQARQRGDQNGQSTLPCDRQATRNCARSEIRSTPSGSQDLPSRPGVPPARTAPAEPGFSNPASGGNHPVRRTQLTRADQDASDLFPSLPIGDANDSILSLNNVGVDSTGAADQQLPNFWNGRQSGSVSPDGISDLVSSPDGLSANAMGANRASDLLLYSAASNGGLSGSASSSLASPGAPALSLTPRYTPSSPVRPPEMVRKLNPYQGIPSLYDMYVQAVPRPAAPKRFGAEVFENGTRDPQLLPMDLPAGPDYVVGPGDGLSIDLWGGVSQRLYRTVDREGRVSLPEVGPILVSGKSLGDVQQNFQQILRTQFRDVSADVSLSRLRTIRIYEVGDVANAGAYDVSSLSTPLNALFAAGGPTPQGSLRILKHYRGNQLVQVVDVYDLLLHGVKAEIKRLENGDTVLVPPIGPQVTVEGMVRRPAVYELKDEKHLASVLELAGGLLPAAALRHIEVQRLVAHEKQTMLNLDIPDAGDTSEVTKKLEAFEIHDGDTVRIFPIAPYNQDTVFLEGHVIRPGRYSYKPDMRVTDIISSYKDLLPEPSTQYAEIIRLNVPDYRPSIESFNLGDALADTTQAPVLRPMDTLLIFSRYDFENPPTVTVGGDVRMPGTYQTPGQIRLADAVHLAGGLAPDAQTADAQVFRYQQDGKFKVFSVILGQALQGDPVENILLQPRDTLLIHRSPDAVQPATASIEGEVTNPGRYPLSTTMRVSDLIRIGGGLTQSADAQTADLTIYKWLDPSNMTAQHQAVSISAALAGDPKSDLPLENGDVLTPAPWLE
jgi:protein involved in polysaccharide export with SLBB domain